MKKRIAAIAAALVLCLGMTSCGSLGDVFGTSETETETETMTEAVTTTTAAETTTAEKSESDDSAKETTKKKKKKKKSSKNDSSSKNSDSKKKTEEKETTAAEVKAEPVPVGFENDYYTLGFSDSDWLSKDKYKSTIAKMAGNNSTLFSESDFNQMLGSLYFYEGDSSKSYPTNFVISNPVYDASFWNLTISQLRDAMVQTIEQQFAAEGGYMTLKSHDIVSHGGLDMLRLRAHGDKDGIVFDCDEYVFLIKGNMCVIAINYGSDALGAAEFEKVLDTITIK